MLPGLLLGFIPMVFAEWLKIVTDKLTSLVLGVWSILALSPASSRSPGSDGATSSASSKRVSGRSTPSSWSPAMACSAKRSGSWPAALRPRCKRCPPGTAPRRSRRDRRSPHLRLRRACALDGVASHPSLRQPRGSELVEDRDRCGSRQQRRRHLRLSRRGRSHLGLRRCHHAPAAHACAFRQGRSQGPQVADRASLRYPRGGRPLWPPHRERAIGPERQSEAEAAARAARCDSRQGPARHRPHHRRHDRRRDFGANGPNSWTRSPRIPRSPNGR